MRGRAGEEVPSWPDGTAACRCLAAKSVPSAVRGNAGRETLNGPVPQVGSVRTQVQSTVRDHVLAPQPGAASARWSRAAWAGYVAVPWLALLVLPIAVPFYSLDSSWYALRLRRMANVAA